MRFRGICRRSGDSTVMISAGKALLFHVVDTRAVTMTGAKGDASARVRSCCSDGASVRHSGRRTAESTILAKQVCRSPRRMIDRRSGQGWGMVVDVG